MGEGGWGVGAGRGPWEVEGGRVVPAEPDRPGEAREAVVEGQVEVLHAERQQISRRIVNVFYIEEDPPLPRIL